MSTIEKDITILKERNNYLKEYLDCLVNGKDDFESFCKEKLDEVCSQISALQGNTDTPEKEAELKALEIKKSVLQDMICEITNNEEDKSEQKSSHFGIGSGVAEMLVETSNAPDLIQGGISGKK